MNTSDMPWWAINGTGNAALIYDPARRFEFKRTMGDGHLCPMCDREYRHASGLARHIRLKHSEGA